MVTITRTQFRYLLVLQVVCFIVLTVLPFVMGQFLNGEDKTIYEYVPEDFSLSPLAIGLSFVLLPVALWALQNLYALFTFKSYAPKHLLIITVLGITIGTLIDPLGIYTYTGLESMVMTLYGMVQGATLACVFTSSVADEFCGCGETHHTEVNNS